MQKVKVQKTGGGQLYIHIPKFVANHFGIEVGQEVWVDIADGEIRVYLNKPERRSEP